MVSDNNSYSNGIAIDFLWITAHCTPIQLSILYSFVGKLYYGKKEKKNMCSKKKKGGNDNNNPQGYYLNILSDILQGFFVWYNWI